MTTSKKLVKALKASDKKWFNVIIKFHQAPLDCPEMTGVDFNCTEDLLQQSVDNWKDMGIAELRIVAV